MNLSNITDKAVVSLAQHAPNLVYLSLAGCTQLLGNAIALNINSLTGEGLASLSSLVNLQTLILGSCKQLKDKNVHAFFSALENSCIQVMDLRGVDMEPNTVMCIADKCPMLRELTLGNFPLVLTNPSQNAGGLLTPQWSISC